MQIRTCANRTTSGLLPRARPKQYRRPELAPDDGKRHDSSSCRLLLRLHVREFVFVLIPTDVEKVSGITSLVHLARQTL